MTSNTILSMLGNIAKWIVISVCLFVLGWTAGRVFDAWAFFDLEWSISVADVLSVIVDIALAFMVAKIIEKSIQDSRVEKDFFIKEIDTVSDILTDLDKICSKETTLSLSTTVYEISRARKLLLRVWKSLEEMKARYSKSHQKDKTELLTALRDLNTRLTDVRSYDGRNDIQPIKLSRGHIYLNATIKPEIDECIAGIKDKLLRMKIGINKM